MTNEALKASIERQINNLRKDIDIAEATMDKKVANAEGFEGKKQAMDEFELEKGNLEFRISEVEKQLAKL